MINIRPAAQEDRDIIAKFQIAMAFETEGLKLVEPTVLLGVSAVLADPSKGKYYVATKGKEVVAVLLTTPEWSDWRNGTVLWIHSLYVLPEHRGQKVFKQMYAHLKSMVESSKDLRGLRLYVEKRNISAQGVYQSIGMSAEHYDLYEWLKG